jgi:adenylate cyclase
MSPDSRSPETDAFWHEFLTRGDSKERRLRRLLLRLPHDPRCRICAAPFAGPGAPLMRLIGKRPSDKSPSMCATCFDFMARHHGGAEVDCTLLFADVRGSTTLAEGMSASSFRALLDRFYDTAARVVFEHEGAVDKFVGDEVVAMFFPLLAGDRHAASGVAAAVAMLQATGNDQGSEPWLPLGAGVHTGRAWIGAVGEGTHTALTVVGDAVNVAARLASAAAAGEVLVTVDAARAAGLSPGLEHRSLALKGRQGVTETVVLRTDWRTVGAR